MTIVCGFRRVHALKQLGISRVFARVLSDSDWDAVKAFELALWDNLSHRQLNPLEKARALIKLKELCGVSDDRLINVYLPVLGLDPAADVLHSFILLSGIHGGLRQCLLEGRLSHSSLERLAGKPAQVQECMAALMDRIRLSASLQKKFLGLLDDLACMTGNPFDAPLKAPQVLSILEDAGLSPFQKGERVYDSLYRLMNPRLSQAIDRFQARKRLLKLPGSIQIRSHPFFEEPGLHVEFKASSADSFRNLASALQDAAQSQELEGLFQVD
jgi:hypothetical protein